MDDARKRSLEEFIEKLCQSLAKDTDSYFEQDHVKHKSPFQIEFYNARLEILSIVKAKVYTHFWLNRSPLFSTSFSLRESSKIPEIREGIFYVNVGQFFEIYEKRKSRGEDFVF
jgi:hypothetical protein